MAAQTIALDSKNAPKSRSGPAYKIKEIRNATGYEALRLMSKERTASNLFLDPLYQSGEMRKVLWTNPIIYMPAGQAFGPTVEFSNVVFLVPKQLQGLKDTALVLPSMSFKIGDSGEKMVLSARNWKKIIAVQNFPQKDGWYLQDANTGIPQGSKVSSDNPTARYLWRRNGEQYIGPVARGCSDDFYDWRGVGADGGLGDACGVALVEHEQTKRKRKPGTALHRNAEHILNRLKPIMRTEDFDVLERAISNGKILRTKK